MTIQLRNLMKYLSKAEGTNIHRIDTESDITAMYGIYKAQHPNATIFKRINQIASFLSLPEKTRDWNEDNIKAINSYIRDKNIDIELTELAASFYEDYLKGARLNEFDKDCVVAMFSMYTHSQKGSWKSVQMAINLMSSNGLIEYKKIEEDGFYGNDTKLGLEKCLYICRTKLNIGLLFESYMLFSMATYYTKLIKGNPTKYIESSNGWDNRLKHLLETR